MIIIHLQGKKGLEQRETFGEETANLERTPNLVPRSLVEEAEGEIWSSNKIYIFFCWLDCKRMTWVLTPGRAMACIIHLQVCSNKYFYLSTFLSQYNLQNLFYLIFTALSNSSFKTSKNGRHFEEVFRACAILTSLTFLTANYVYQSDSDQMWV